MGAPEAQSRRGGRRRSEGGTPDDRTPSRTPVAVSVSTPRRPRATSRHGPRRSDRVAGPVPVNVRSAPPPRSDWPTPRGPLGQERDPMQGRARAGPGTPGVGRLAATARSIWTQTRTDVLGEPVPTGAGLVTDRSVGGPRSIWPARPGPFGPDLEIRWAGTEGGRPPVPVGVGQLADAARSIWPQTPQDDRANRFPGGQGHRGRSAGEPRSDRPSEPGTGRSRTDPTAIEGLAN